MLSGCTDSEKVAEIQELTAKKDSLERNIGILRIKADSLARENEALHKSFLIWTWTDLEVPYEGFSDWCRWPAGSRCDE